MAAIARQRRSAITISCAMDHGFPSGLKEYVRSHAIRTGAGIVNWPCSARGKPVHIVDVQADPEYRLHEVVAECGIRTMLGVPLLRGRHSRSAPHHVPADSEAVHRQADRAGRRPSPIRPSSPSRTRGCSTSCASAPTISARRWSSRPRPREVLKVISSSPGELEPVFDAMLENATRICEANSAICMLLRGRRVPVRRDARGRPACDRIAAARTGCRRRSDIALDRVVETKQVQHIADMRGEQGYLAGDDRWSVRASRPALAPSRRADAQGERSGRRHHHLPPGGPAVHRQADRAGQQFRRPGRHRHREHPAAQRAARSRCSSRPPPPTCSRSSAARPSICRRCSTRWSSRRRGFARPTWRQSDLARERSIRYVASYGFTPECDRVTCENPLPLKAAADRPSGGRARRQGRSHRSTSWPIAESRYRDGANRVGEFAPCSACRCCARDRRSA